MARKSKTIPAAVASLDEKARAAFTEARRMRRGLVAAARVFTGNPKLQIDFHATRACTDGVDKIWLRVPIELADLPEHEVDVCQTRDEDFIQRCPRCAVLEDVQITLLHEIAHIVHDTFEKVTGYERANILKAAIDAECGGDDSTSRAAKLKHRIETAPKEVTSDYLNLLNLVSPFLPVLFNACEDIRVNGNMMRDLPGTEVMFRAQTNKIFKHGFKKIDGEDFHWKDAEVNAQAIIAVYCKVQNFDYRPWLNEDVVAAVEDDELDRLCEAVAGAKSARQVYRQCFPLLERLRELGYCKSPDDPENDPEPEPEPEPEEQPEPETPSMEQEPGDTGDDPGEGESEDDDQSSNEQPEEGDDDQSDDDGDDDTEGDTSGDSEPGDDEDSAGDGEPDDDDAEGSAPGDDEQDDAPDEAAGSDSDGDDPSGDPSDDGEADGTEGEDSDESGSPGDDEGEGDEADADDTEGADHDGGTEPSPEPEEGDGDGESDDELSDDADDAGGEGEGSDDAPADEPGDGDESSDSDGDEPGEGDGESPTEGTGDPADSDTEGTADGEAEGDPGDPSSDPSDTGQESPLDGQDTGQAGDPAPEEGPGDTDAPAGDSGPDTAGKEQQESSQPEPYTEEQMEEDGTPSDIERLLNIFGGHEDKNNEDPPLTHSERMEEYDLQEAIERVSEQIDVFDRPSINVGTLKVIKYGEHEDEWRSPWSTRRDRSDRELIEVSEGILMNALQKLRLAFQDNKRGSNERNRKSGKIDTRVLGKRISTGDERLFHKRILPGKKDYFVVVGLDVSGSTSRPLDGGARWSPDAPCILDMMKAACAAKCELLNRLGVRFAVYAHSGDTTSVEIFEIKGPDEKWTPKCKRALAELQPYSANLDGHTMEFYRKVAQAGTETDRVILYYTDGAMPLENYEEELEILQDEIKTCQKLGIDLIAIGVRNDDPIEHGLDTIRLDEVSDIPTVVEGLRKRLQK